MKALLSKLESIGASADYRYDKERIELILANEIDETLLHDYLADSKSTHQLELLLQTRSNLVCGLQPADVPDEEPRKDEPEDDDDDEELKKQHKNILVRAA